MTTTTQIPEPGGWWTSYGTACRVARVEVNAPGGPRWLPAHDVTGDKRLDGLRMVLAHLGEDFRPAQPGDRRCSYCQEAGAR